jgi:predicted protein tyrosine phosphatase
MNRLPAPTLTICGLDELALYSGRGVTHVVSILDPDHPEPEAFASYERHHRTVMRFHDAITPGPGVVLPAVGDVETVLAFGDRLAREDAGCGHVLVHCHAGISRSAAVMAILLAQHDPGRDEDDIFELVVSLRPKAWPNSSLIAMADDLLGRGGRLNRALGRHYKRQLVVFPFVEQFMRDNGRAQEVDMAG